MSKKPLKADETLLEDKPSMVSVEMTEDQLQEYSSWKVAQKSLPAIEEEPEPLSKAMFRMNLIFDHYINGVKYGGNNCEVPEYLVGVLQEQEENKRQFEMKMHTSSDRMFQVMNSGQSIPVAVRK